MKRITSIDALRAFALFGILLIHARQGFGSGGVRYYSTIDYVLGGGVKYFFEGRFILIFNILFGVSFFIILSKKDYPSSRFVWRCFLLAMLGLLNRVFFNNDVLFKYGLCGMFLVPIRKMPVKSICYLVLTLLLSGVLLERLDLGTSITYLSRYTDGLSFLQFVKTYPSSLLMLVKQFLNGDYLIIYACMGIGYILGKTGIIESMDFRIQFSRVLVSLILYFLIGGFFYGTKYFGIHIPLLFGIMLKYLFWFSGSVFYWVFFLYLYNKSDALHRVFALFEPYGKLGLTNYTMQGFLGVLLFYFCGLSRLGLSFSTVFLMAILFFLLQALFSSIWLRFFKNGPLEYVWRCATVRKWLPFRVN